MLPAWILYQKVRAAAAPRVDAGGVAEGAGVGVSYRLFQVAHADDAGHGAEDVLRAGRHLGAAVVEHGGAHEVAPHRSVEWVQVYNHSRPRVCR